MTPILGPAQVTQDVAYEWAVSRGAHWLPAFYLTGRYWQIAPQYGVRPEVAFVQAFHETGKFRYGRAVTPEHHNYCGLKIPDPAGLADDDPEAHARMPTPEFGIHAHCQHDALYAGAPGMPLPWRQLTATDWSGAHDPRHFSWLRGRATTVEALGGKWAPSTTYGDRLVANLSDLLSREAMP